MREKSILEEWDERRNAIRFLMNAANHIEPMSIHDEDFDSRREAARVLRYFADKVGAER